MASVREMYQQLEPDPWRTEFSEDIESVHRAILKTGATQEDIGRTITRPFHSWTVKCCVFVELYWASQGYFDHAWIGSRIK